MTLNVCVPWKYKIHRSAETHSQAAITSSKLTIETVEQGVKYVQS